MPSPTEKLARIAERQHSVFRRAQALRCGFSPDAIDGRLARGWWLRLHRSVYTVRGSALTFESRVLAATFAGGEGCVASHATAAMLFRLEGVASREVHITTRRRVRVPGIVAHESRALGNATRIGRIPVTTPVRTLIDIAGALTASALDDALDDALRRRLLDIDACRIAINEIGSRGRRGVATLSRFIEVRVGRRPSGSGRENDLRRILDRAKLPPPIHQYEIRTQDGALVARPDFAYPDIKVAIEFDGYAFHSSRKAFEHDRVRQNRMVDLGWLPLRVTDRQLKHGHNEVIDLIRRRFPAPTTGKRRRKAR